MALHTLLNHYLIGETYTGGNALFLIKNVLVAAGWSVVASGDGDARVATPLTADLPLGQQGSGGAKDAWATGVLRAVGTRASLVAGDAANAAAWIVLGNSGREMLIATPSNTATAYDHSFTILITASGHSFDYSTATATVPPGAPALAAAERALMGTRATIATTSTGFIGSNGADSNSWISLVAGDSVEDPDNLGFWMINGQEGSNANSFRAWGCLPLVAGSLPTTDPDNVIWIYHAASGLVTGSSSTASMWDYVNNVWRNSSEFLNNETSAVFSGATGLTDVTGTPRLPATAFACFIQGTTPDLWKGYVNVNYAIRTALMRTNGNIAQDPITSYYYIAPNFATSSFVMLRWPSATVLRPFGG